MALVVDSYSETNQNANYSLFWSGPHAAGQTFTGNGLKLNSAVFYMQKSGAPTGTMNAQLFATTGTFGTSSCVPTGSPLATSANVTVASSLTTSYQLITFTFSTHPVLTNGTHYAIVVDVSNSNGTSSDIIQIGQNTANPSGHPGNRVNFDDIVTGTWAASGSIDACFYVYGDQFTASQPAIARIANTKTKTQSAVARLAQKYSATQTATAKVGVKVSTTQTAKAYLLAKRVATQTATATIIGPVTKTQAAKAAIAQPLSATQSASARVANNFFTTQLAVSRIANKPTKTQTATASLISKRTKTQTAIARVKRVVTATQTATASIVFPPPIMKRHDYKVYRGGVFLGMLPNVITLPDRGQDINTVGTQMTITVGVSPDVAGLPATAGILTEGGDSLTDENGNILITEGAVNIVGTGADTTLIKNGNQIVVIEYSQYYPNGVPIFRGEMQRWEASYGGPNQNETINILAYSDGNDFNNYLISGSPFVSDQSQTTHNTSYSIFTAGAAFAKVGQTITTGSAVTNFGALDVLLDTAGTDQPVTVKLWPDVASANAGTGLLGSITQTVNAASATVFKFAFGTPIAVSSSTQYFATVETTSTSGVNIYYQNTSVYASGDMYVAAYGGGGGSTAYSNSGGLANLDMYFVSYSNAGQTTAVFTGQDPTTGMLESAMNNYNLRGGKVTYNSGTIDATGLSLNYEFNTSTMKDGLATILSLSPDGFYYYTDLGSSQLNFKNASTTPDIVLTKGRHLDDITIIATIENIANQYFFIGGLVSGSNKFKVYQDATSISEFGPRLVTATDNRVKDDTTADAIGGSFIAENKDEQYQTTVTVLDGTMDILLFKVGQIVGFNGFGSFADQLQLQIVRIDWTPEEATLTLGQLPPRTTITLAEITRTLLAQQTINNPSSPS